MRRIQLSFLSLPKSLSLRAWGLSFSFKISLGAIITSGASATEASAGLIQFSQGLASGTLRGDELRSVLEQLPRLARAIADGLGITVGELRELGSAGALTGEQVLRAIQSQAGQIAKEFAEIDRTAAQAFTQLESAFLRAAGISADTAGGTEQVVAAIDGLREVVEDPEVALGGDVEAGS